MFTLTILMSITTHIGRPVRLQNIACLLILISDLTTLVYEMHNNGKLDTLATITSLYSIRMSFKLVYAIEPVNMIGIMSQGPCQNYLQFHQ